MLLAEATWTQVDDYLKGKDVIIIPIGSVEQHGPTGLIGTDYMTSEGIAHDVGERCSVLVAPPICYGMALHHMDFPGSATLMPETLIHVIVDVVESFKRHGFKKILFVNGHGGNIAVVTTAFCKIKCDTDDSVLDLMNWWRMPEVQAYEQEHFGDQNGFHATVGEVAVTMAYQPKAFEKIPPRNFEIERPKHDWPLSPKEFRATFPDGRMESNPGLATAEHGKVIAGIAIDAISKRIDQLLAT